MTYKITELVRLVKYYSGETMLSATDFIVEQHAVMIKSRCEDEIRTRAERGTLALTDRHFILVTEPEGGWLAGSGRYEKTGDDIRFEAMRWFEVRDGKADYAADGTFEATFDGKMLKLPGGLGFRVAR